MNEDLATLVENQYPYPIAADFRRLLTLEYSEPGIERLQKILEVTENAAHFIALLSLCELQRLVLGEDLLVPESYKREFAGRISKTTMGKWIALARDSLALIRDFGKPAFVEELPGYFFAGGSSPSPAQDAFNKLSALRNNLAHPTLTLGQRDYVEACGAAEGLLEAILAGFRFIARYKMLNIEDVRVEYHRWSAPAWSHSVADAAGHSGAFKPSQVRFHDLMYTPSALIAKKGDDPSAALGLSEALSLEPLVLRSDEGSSKIKDVFLCQDVDFRGAKVAYRACDKGGTLSLGDCDKREVLGQGILFMLRPFLEQRELGTLERGLVPEARPNGLLEGLR